MNKEGILYCLKNLNLENRYKIGYTTDFNIKNLISRYSTYWGTNNIDIIHIKIFDNISAVEKHAFKELKQFHYEKELYEIPIDKLPILTNVFNNILVNNYTRTNSTNIIDILNLNELVNHNIFNASFITIIKDDYLNNYNIEKMEIINEFLDNILPNKEVQDYILLIIASSLFDKTLEENVYFFTSKDTENTVQILFQMLNNSISTYIHNITNELTYKKIKKIESKKIIIIPKINENDKIQRENLNKLIKDRKNTNFKINTSYFIEVKKNNNIYEELTNPIIINLKNKKMDEVINRILINKLRETDIEFTIKILEYAKKYYNEYYIKNLQIKKPKEILRINKKTRDETIKFIEEYFEYSEDKKAKIFCKTAWKKYLDWCDDNRKIKVKQKELEEEIEYYFDLEPKKRISINNNTNNGWFNIKLK